MDSRASSSRGSGKGRRLLVTRLAFYTKKEDLVKAFKSYGIQHAVVLRKPTGNQGFLTFSTPEQAERVAAAEFIIHKRKVIILRADSWHEAKLRIPRPAVNPLSDSVEKIFLPIQCIAKIASYLPFADRSRLELVSRSWRMGALASFNEIKHIDLTDWRWPDGWDGKTVTTEAFYWLIQRAGRTAQSIKIADETLSKLLHPQILAITIRNCPRLSNIDLTAISIRPSAVRNLIEIASTIKHLGLGQCQGTIETELTETLAKAANLLSFKAKRTTLSGKCLTKLTPNLEQLTLCRCENLRSEFLAKTIANQQKLMHLELNFREPLADNNILHALETNTRLHRTLITLKIHSCAFNETQLNQEEALDENEMEVKQGDFVELNVGPVEQALPVFRRYNQLTELNVTFCGWVTEETVREISINMPLIEHLNLSGCTNVRSESALDPLASLVHLKKLEVNNMYLTVEGGVFRLLQAIEEIHCRENLGINDEDVCGPIRNCPYLNVIDVEGCQNVGKLAITGATNIIRGSNRTHPLTMYVGGTAVTRRMKVKRNFFVRIIYYRRYEPLFS